jgi:hypothetical protein
LLIGRIDRELDHDLGIGWNLEIAADGLDENSTGDPRNPPATNQSLVASLDWTWQENAIIGSTPTTIAPCSGTFISVALWMFLPKR